MDKREFYKQLMSQYTFDEDKIRKNAKRKHSRSFITSKWMPVASAAAVFIAVFASYTFVPTFLNGNTPIVETEAEGGSPNVDSFSASGISSVSASERLADMEYNDYLIKNNIMSALENRVMYISFENPMTPNEYLAALETYISDTGEIETLSLWKNSFVDEDNADKNEKYLAAKISAPVSFYKNFIDCPIFSGVDFDNKINDDNFEPLITDKKERAEETPVTDVPAETEAITSVSEVSEVSEDAAPAETEAEEEVKEEEPETSEGSQAISLLSIPLSDIVEVEFINDDHFIALTESSISLYRITDELEYQLVSSYKAKNPKISFTNWGTNIMLILDGERTELFIADGARSELVLVDTSEITVDANIACAYSGGEDVFIKTIAVDSSYNAFYLAVRDGQETTLQLLEKLTDKTSLLAFNNESFIYAVVSDKSSTEFLKVNYRNGTVVNLDIDISGDLSFVRSNDLTNFAILRKALKKAWVWNSQTGKLTSAYETDIVSFTEYNSDIFTDGIEWYEFWGSDVRTTTIEEANASSFKPMLSSTYKVSDVTAEDVKFEINR